MKKKSLFRRILALAMTAAMLTGLAIPAGATGASNAPSVMIEQVDNSAVTATLPGREPVELPENENTYAASDVVRVSIVLESEPTIEAGFSTEDIAHNEGAIAYRENLQAEQESVMAAIESEALDNEPLNVIWNLTLAANIISAEVAYGDIEAIAAVDGVKEVVIETRYEPMVVAGNGEADPNMATSGKQIGSAAAWTAGYTGAGSRVAIIDTGVDYMHEAFDAGAFEYSLGDAMSSLNLLDSDEIAGVLEQLNAYERDPSIDADSLYFSSKIPFGYNYIDRDYDISHLSDKQGEHGSHVASIATANKYVSVDDNYVAALESTKVQGVAPDAQLITMKVFGKNGGAYDSDYMAAIEDAVVLGCDAVNLSLGSGNPGMSRNSNATYQGILDSLVKSGVVVAMSAGNSGYWAENVENEIPYLYADDVSMQTDGSPGSFTNSLAVASVDNDGTTGLYVTVDGSMVLYTESDYSNDPLATLAGERDYVFINAVGKPEDFAKVDVAGKIALCYRGETSFFEKAEAAVEEGAIAVIIVNNQSGIINMDLSDYSYTAPAVSILQADGELFKLGEAQIADGLEYWTGTMTVSESVGTGQYNSDYYTMSSFSSWGVPGSLELKPEITAPGGNIYAVNGDHISTGSTDPGASGHDKYEIMSGTSMASPQVAGMAAVVAQYIRENDLTTKTGLDARTLINSLLMSTAVPMLDVDGYYYPVIQQGAGLANVGAAVSADSYILMDADATASYEDGKIKAELGDDPDKDGVYSFSFIINNMDDEAKDFVLSADAFMQYPIFGGRDYYMHTSTDFIPCIVDWESSGELSFAGDLGYVDYYDINGDGLVDEDDGQMILDYTVGLIDEISELADVDGDGDIDTYDAYLFFNLNLNTETVTTVPANGSVTVEVTLDVNAYAEVFDYYFPNGTYIQAYVYADSVSTEEGVEGTSHSIPVLGFYGNWSAPSMFDKGSYIEYANGLETRPPYLLMTNLANGNLNSFLVQYDGERDLYHYGGNPFFEEEYMPERNSFSGVNGDKIAKIGFTAIRNAAASAFYVRNAETGEYYDFVDLGAVESAYYYVNGQTWENTYYTVPANFVPDYIPEDTEIEIGLVLVPEYYLMSGGAIDLDELGDGAFFSVTTTVDNTAPVLAEENGIVIDTDADTMTITASDNRYIAFVGLFDGTGRTLLEAEGSKADAAEGEEVVYTLDISEVNGGVFLLQVADYANNISTYKIEQVIGDIVDTVDSVTVEPETITLLKGSTAQLTAIVLPSNTLDNTVTWTSSDDSIVSVDANGKLTANAVGEATITATSNGDDTKSGTCSVEVIEIDVDLNGIVWDEEGSIWFSEFNTTELPEYVKLSGDLLNTDTFVSATVGPDGTLYACSMDSSTGGGSLYTIDTATWTATKLADCNLEGIDFFCSDMTYISQVFGGALLGTYGPYVMAFDAATGAVLGILDEFESELVGIANCYGEDGMDIVYLIQNDGAVIQEIYVDGSVLGYPGYVFIYSDLMNNGERFSMDSGYDVGETWYFNSAYYDGTYLYWSAFDLAGDDNDVELLAIDADYTGAVYSLGTFAEGVWPVAGLYQDAASGVSGDFSGFEIDLEQARAVIEEMGLPEFELVKRELNSAKATGSLNAIEKSDVEFADETLLTVELTAVDSNGDEVASTNGVQTVTYDADVMKLVSVTVNGDYRAINRYNDMGKVTVAYVDVDGIPAGATTATLVFEIIDPENTEITVEYEEVNTDDAGFEETLELSAVELTDAPEAPVVRPSNPVKPGGSDKPVDTDEPAESELTFTDVEESDSFYESVKYVFENGIMNGVGEDTFAPDSDLTRAMVVTVLYRLENKPAVDFAGIFSDVAAGKWYSEAVEWAAANGIVNGYGEGVFGPEDAVTRQQLAAILFRYAQFKGIEAITLAELVAGFADSSDVAEYAISAMNWALSKGIIAETAVGTLAPKANATRAEVAVALHMFMENVLG